MSGTVLSDPLYQQILLWRSFEYYGLPSKTVVEVNIDPRRRYRGETEG